MAKKWINSLDVEVRSNGTPVVDLTGCESFAGGTRTVASAAKSAELVSAPTPCSFVWIGARVDSDGNPLNTKPCFVGDAGNQNIPILPSNYEGIVLRIDDAQKIFIKAGVNGQGVVYRVFI